MSQNIRERWSGPEGQSLTEEVFARLLAGRPLDDLKLGEHDGRIDLRGIPAPIPTRLKRYEFEDWFVEEVSGKLEFQSVRLESLDFSQAFLDSLLLFHVKISNCRFDGAVCQGWRMWATDVTDASFEGADLRSMATGSWYEGRGTAFRRVSFRNANLKSFGSLTATFTDCDFSDAKIVNVDFGSSSFIRCRFAGKRCERECAESEGTPDSRNGS